MYNELGRVPEDEELAVELDMNYDKFQRTLAQSANAVTLSFEELIFEDSIDRLSSRNDSEGVDFAILEKELKNVIKIAIGELKPKEKQVITLYYYKRLKFSDIAKVLSVTESRFHKFIQSNFNLKDKAGGIFMNRGFIMRKWHDYKSASFKYSIAEYF